MMKNQERFMKAFVLIFLALFTSCFSQQAKVPSPTPTPIPLIPVLEDQIPEPPKDEKKFQPAQIKESVEKKLENYLYGREIVPSIIVNNTEGDQTKINLENTIVEWIRGEKETKIKINGDLFSLKDQKTINDFENGRKEDVDFANDWEQIKFYKFGERKIIGISMGNEPCTGIGCSVAFQLIYDLKTKHKTFFGTYRIEREVNLYDFKNDGTIDYLGKTYIGESDGVAKEVSNLYKLYPMDEKGIFHLQLDKNQNPYFIKRFFEAESYSEIDKKFEANWIEEIK